MYNITKMKKDIDFFLKYTSRLLFPLVLQRVSSFFGQTDIKVFIFIIEKLLLNKKENKFPLL